MFEQIPGRLACESGPVLLLRQILPERITTTGNFDQGKHDKHSDDNRKDYSEGFLGHGGLAEGLMMSHVRSRRHRAHMPFVTKTLSGVSQDKISGLSIELSGSRPRQHQFTHISTRLSA